MIQSIVNAINYGEHRNLIVFLIIVAGIALLSYPIIRFITKPTRE